MKLKAISYTNDTNRPLGTSPETYGRVEPIYRTDLQTHARLPTGTVLPQQDLDYLDILIAAARSRIEGYECGCQLINATFDGYLDRFPSSYLIRDGYNCSDVIEIARPPLQSVAGVFYIDDDGVEQEFTEYTVQLNWTPGVTPSELPANGYILLNDGESWPSIRSQPDAVRVRFTAGFGESPIFIPEAIRQWMLIAAGTMYEHRESEIDGVFNQLRFVDGLLDPWRIRKAVR